MDSSRPPASLATVITCCFCVPCYLARQPTPYLLPWNICSLVFTTRERGTCTHLYLFYTFKQTKRAVCCKKRQNCLRLADLAVAAAFSRFNRWGWDYKVRGLLSVLPSAVCPLVYLTSFLFSSSLGHCPSSSRLAWFDILLTGFIRR